MKKYRIASNWSFEQFKKKQKCLKPWEIEYRRFTWREHYRDTQYFKHTISFGDSLDAVSSSEEIDELAFKKIYIQHLYELLNQLTDDERYIINAYYFEGKSDEKIAVNIGKNQRTVNRERKRILCKLRIMF